MQQDGVAIGNNFLKTSLTEALLKFLALLKKILKGQNLTTGPQCYAMTKNRNIGKTETQP